jgi:hypothetical protein
MGYGMSIVFPSFSDKLTHHSALITATVGGELSISKEVPELIRVVGAMFWISAKLTFVMLCVVPPVSLGAVSGVGGP